VVPGAWTHAGQSDNRQQDLSAARVNLRRRRSQPPLVNRPGRRAEFHRTTAYQHCSAPPHLPQKADRDISALHSERLLAVVLQRNHRSRFTGPAQPRPYGRAETVHSETVGTKWRPPPDVHRRERLGPSPSRPTLTEVAVRLVPTFGSMFGRTMSSRRQRRVRGSLLGDDYLLTDATQRRGRSRRHST